MNGGTCVQDSKARLGYKCECAVGYDGPRCKEQLIGCMSNPCKSNEVCINNSDSYVCVCIPGMSCQQTSELASLFSPASSLFTKASIVKQLTTSKLNSSPCSSNPCQNDGICDIGDRKNQTFICKCKFGYIGKLLKI
jgi:hypothetical protein